MREYEAGVNEIQDVIIQFNRRQEQPNYTHRGKRESELRADQLYQLKLERLGVFKKDIDKRVSGIYKNRRSVFSRQDNNNNNNNNNKKVSKEEARSFIEKIESDLKQRYE